MARIPAQRFANLVKSISDITGIPNSRELAIKKGNKFYLYLDYAAEHGGYRLINEEVSGGTQYGAFGASGIEARRKPKEMESYLKGLLYGLLFEKEKTNALEHIFIIYKTDVHHSYSSRDTIGICTTLNNVMKIIKAHVKKEGKKLDAEQIGLLESICQTQGYEGEGEFHFEEMEVNKLL